MQGVQGSMNSAVNLVHAKALVEGETGATGSISIGGVDYAVVFGYPAAETRTAAPAGLGIASLIELDTNSDVTITNATPAVATHSGTPTGSVCNLSYANATGAETPPVLTATLTAC